MKLEKFEGKSYQLINSGGARFQIRSTRPKRPSSDYTIKYWKNYYRLTFETQQDIDTFRAGVLGSPDDTNTIWTDENNTYNYISKTYFDGKRVRQIGRGFGIYSMGQTYSLESGKCCIALLVDEEAEDITKPSPTEKKMWAEQKEIDNNKKIINNFFAPGLSKIAEQYHLTFREHSTGICLDFETASDVQKFVITALNELVMNKLKGIGVTAEVCQKGIEKGLKHAYIYGPAIDELKVDKTALQ